jgi:hypothetical protein
LSTDAIDDAKGTPSVSEAQVEDALRKFFQMVDRLITVLRVYPMHHPLIDQVAERCLERLAEVLSHGEIKFDLTPSELIGPSGKPVFTREDSESERFIWYNPHSDGLRQVILHPALNIEELIRFMRVIDKVAQDGVISDDDTITLLWDQHLESIDYRSVDAFIDNEIIEEFNNRTPKQMTDMIVEAAVRPSGSENKELGTMFGDVGITSLDWFSSARLKHSLESKPQAIGREHLEYALALKVDKIDGLYAEWTTGGELEFRFIEALLSIIRSAPESEAAASAQKAIEQMGIEMIEREMYGEAHRVLVLLRSRAALFEKRQSNPFDVILATISEPQAIEGLLWRMQKAEHHRLPLVDLLSLLKATLVEGQLLKVLGEPELPDAACLMKLLFRVHKDRPKSNREATAAIDAKLLEKIHFLERVVANVGDHDLSVWPSAPKVVAAALNSKNATLQQMTIKLEGSFWTDQKFIDEVLLPLIDHADESIRSRAYEILSFHQPTQFERRIRKLITDGNYGDKSLGELKFLFRRFAELSGDRVDELYGCIEGHKGWIKGPKKMAALAAAQALVERGDQRAVSLVQARIKNPIVAPAFKKSLSMILQNHRPKVSAEEKQ